MRQRTQHLLAGLLPNLGAGSGAPQGLRATLLRGGFGSIGLIAGQIGCSFLISVALARMLGAEGFGIYAFAYALAMVFAIPAQTGISQLVIRETARGLATDDTGSIRGLWTWSTRAVATLALVSSSLIIAGCAALDAQPAVMLAAGLIPPVALGALRGAVLTGLHRVVLGRLPESIFRPAGLLLLLLLAPVLLGWEELLPTQAIGLHIAASLVAFALGTILVYATRPAKVGAADPIYHSRRWVSAVLPLSLVAGLQLLINNTDILMLGMLRSDAEVGVYRVISQCSVFVVFGLQAFNTVVAPHFASIHAEGNFAALQSLAVATARVGVIIALPLAAIFAIWGEAILDALFGLEYVGGYVALLILISGRVLNAALGQVGLLLQMTGNEKYALVGTVFAASLNILLNLLFIPRFGIEGAATATAITLVASHLLLRHFVRANVGIETSIVHLVANPQGKI